MAKKSYVVNMFNTIAPSYDKLNHILSLNVDKSWRRKAVDTIVATNPQFVLDVASGTGDFAIAIAQGGVPKVLGVDVSEGMLEVGKVKIEKLGLSDRIQVQVDDCEALSIPDNSVDGVSVAFGVRNFEHLELGLKEMLRVLKPGGQLVILELSVPSNPILLWGYKLYFLHILPFIGGVLSGSRDAYRYLPVSVLNFPKPEVVLDMMTRLGYKSARQKAFTFGLCRMFVGQK